MPTELLVQYDTGEDVSMSRTADISRAWPMGNPKDSNSDVSLTSPRQLLAFSTDPTVVSISCISCSL